MKNEYIPAFFVQSLPWKLRWNLWMNGWVYWSRPRGLFMHPDLCIWIGRYFRFGYSRKVKIGETKGFSMFSVGPLTFSVRW